MIIQKDINNLDRIKDKMATMPLAYEDAIEFHKRVIERVEKERKETNKALGIGDISKDGFTGASKNPKKVSKKNLKKMHLSESLFQSVKKNFLNEESVFRAGDLAGMGEEEFEDERARQEEQRRKEQEEQKQQKQQNSGVRHIDEYSPEEREAKFNQYSDAEGNSLVRQQYMKNHPEEREQELYKENKKKYDKLYRERDWDKDYEIAKDRAAQQGGNTEFSFEGFLRQEGYSETEIKELSRRYKDEARWKEMKQQKSEEERANKEKEDKAKALQKYRDDKIWNSMDWIKEREDIGADNFDNFLDKYMQAQRNKLENKLKAQQGTDTLSNEDSAKIQSYLENERRVIKDRLNEFDNDEVAQDKYREKRQKEEEQKQKEFEDNLQKQIQNAKGAMKKLPGDMNRTLSNLGINLKYANRKRK